MSMEHLSATNASWRDGMPYLPIYVAVGVLLIVLELVAMGWVASSQVERSSHQHAQASALRTRLWGCLDAGPGALVDKCRADVMASAGMAAADTSSRSATQLAVWSSDPDRAPDMARAGIVPVSLVQGMR